MIRCRSQVFFIASDGYECESYEQAAKNEVEYMLNSYGIDVSQGSIQDMISDRKRIAETFGDFVSFGTFSWEETPS